MIQYGLGDYVHDGLEYIGITPERVTSVKRMALFWKNPDEIHCNCEARQDWLNEKFPYSHPLTTIVRRLLG